MKILLLSAILLLPGFQETVPEKDLSPLWKVYSLELDRLLPIEDADNTVTNLSFVLDESFNPGELRITSCSNEANLIYVNKIPFGTFHDTIQISLESLPQKYQSSRLLFTIYFKNPLTLDCVSTTIKYSDNLIASTSTRLQDSDGLEKKDYSYFTNFIITALILIGFISIYTFRRSSGEITDLWGIARSLSLRNRDELLLKNKPFDKLGISILILLSIIVSFVYEVAYFLNSESLVTLHVIRNSSFWSLLGNWAILSFGLFVFFSLKYILISAFASLFNLENFKYIQHYNNLRVAIWVFSLGLLVYTSIYFVVRSPDISWFVPFLYALPALLFIRLLIVFLKLISEGRYTVFHLFSYFCATEILPFLLVFKFILD